MLKQILQFLFKIISGKPKNFQNLSKQHFSILIYGPILHPVMNNFINLKYNYALLCLSILEDEKSLKKSFLRWIKFLYICPNKSLKTTYCYDNRNT